MTVPVMIEANHLLGGKNRPLRGPEAEHDRDCRATRRTSKPIANLAPFLLDLHHFPRPADSSAARQARTASRDSSGVMTSGRLPEEIHSAK